MGQFDNKPVSGRVLIGRSQFCVISESELDDRVWEKLEKTKVEQHLGRISIIDPSHP